MFFHYEIIGTYLCHLLIMYNFWFWVLHDYSCLCISTFQSYVSFSHGGRVVPAVWFRYDLTPITVKYHFKRPPFYSFITTVSIIFWLILSVGKSNVVFFSLFIFFFWYEFREIKFSNHSLHSSFYIILNICFQVCAIVGGTFTVAGIIDSFIFTAAEIFKKIEIGKQSWISKYEESFAGKDCHSLLSEKWSSS